MCFYFLFLPPSARLRSRRIVGAADATQRVVCADILLRGHISRGTQYEDTLAVGTGWRLMGLSHSLSLLSLSLEASTCIHRVHAGWRLVGFADEARNLARQLHDPA